MAPSTHAIASLHLQTSLKSIFRTLQNQAGDIFNGIHNAHNESITACLENLGKLISPDDEDRIDDLFSFIENGICRVSNSYEVERDALSPEVLNFLMTAIRSYNHIAASGSEKRAAYSFTSKTCPGASDAGNAFLVQILIPHIAAGALHVFPVGSPLTFKVNVPQSFIMRSPSPSSGPRRPGISFGNAAIIAKKSRRRHRRNQRKLRYSYPSASSDSDSGSGSGTGSGSGSNGGSIRKKRAKTLSKKSRMVRVYTRA